MSNGEGEVPRIKYRVISTEKKAAPDESPTVTERAALLHLVPVPEKAAVLPGLPPLGIGLHLGVSHVRYCSDPCERPSLSSSIANTLATESPLHAWYKHPRLGGGENDFTRSTARGSIIHALLLGIGQEIVEVEADSFRTKDAQQKRDAAIEAGKVPVISSTLEEYRKAADQLRERLRAKGILLQGQSEVTAVWERDGVLCRARFDHWTESELLIDDIKTCESAAPWELARKMITYGYDVQHSHYVDAAEVIVPNAAGRVRMRFIFCEAGPPYDVVVVEAAGTLRELGDRKRRRALRSWAACLKADKWPGYADGVVKLQAPEWALTRDLENQMTTMETSADGVVKLQAPEWALTRDLENQMTTMETSNDTKPF